MFHIGQSCCSLKESEEERGDEPTEHEAQAFSGLAVQEAQARRRDARHVPGAVRRRRYGGAIWEAGYPNGGFGKDEVS